MNRLHCLIFLLAVIIVAQPLLHCFAALLSSITPSEDVVFYEPFDDPIEGRWITSEKEDYKGIWKLSKSEGHDDYGLLLSEKAKKYAIVKQLDDIYSFKDENVILQLEVRLQNGLECGGAYLKYLKPLHDSWDPREFDSNCPYSIMFGPDRCGSTTNKVHFIINHRNPKTGELIEHHLKYPPLFPDDKLTHVYTAIIRSSGNELSILIDGQEKKKANFLSSQDFEPPLVSQKTITDPDDKKPDDWDEREKIPDSTAVKPDDWDEEEPLEIEDGDAKKPEGWLDNEPEEIEDPHAVQPEDWDDEEDGKWEPPKMENSKCVVGPGCGEWKRPMKRNPAYKGKWKAPLIDNPNYKGTWKPREIPNPDYYQLDKPDFEPIAAIGIEIWTMQDGILFDNILITRDEKVAEIYREQTWKLKFEVEKKQKKVEEAGSGLRSKISNLRVIQRFDSYTRAIMQKNIFDLLYKFAEAPLLEAYKPKIIDLIENGKKKPDFTIGVLASLVVVTLTAFFGVLSRGRNPAVGKKDNKKRISAIRSDDQRGMREQEKEAQSCKGNESSKEVVAPRRRKKPRRET